ARVGRGPREAQRAALGQGPPLRRDLVEVREDARDDRLELVGDRRALRPFGRGGAGTTAPREADQARDARGRRHLTGIGAPERRFALLLPALLPGAPTGVATSGRLERAAARRGASVDAVGQTELGLHEVVHEV